MIKKIATAIVIVVLILFIYFYYRPTSKNNKITATVAKVIDGDTIQLVNGDKIRLLGIDSPEKDQLFYEEIKNQLKKIEGKAVKLEKDVTNKDKYGRFLRYVFLNDYFVNLELVKNGLAYAYVSSPDTKYEKEFFKAENIARENGLGVWKKSNYSSCIEIEKFHYNAKGNDNENLNDEYVIFQNICEFDINIGDWKIKDKDFNFFNFPNFVFKSKSSLTLFTGKGMNTNNELYWNNDKPIWNNAGDTLYLRDKEGNLILSESYVGY